MGRPVLPLNLKISKRIKKGRKMKQLSSLFKITGIDSGNFRCSSTLAFCRQIGFGVLASIALTSAQEGSVILKSLDNLEKRLIKVEADIGKVRKSSSNTPATVSVRPDSLSAGFSLRLDSLAQRVHALESAAVAKPTSAPMASEISAITAPKTASNPTSTESEIASLVREVKTLTQLLKQGKSTAAPANMEAAAKPSAAPQASEKSATPALPVSPPVLELKGDIQIQGERKFSAKSNRDNLDDFWGRLNFGAEYKAKEFESKINIRIFPEGFGFEPLTGATFDTVGQGAIKTQTTPQSRVVINHAWAKYSLGDARLKIGRFETVETQSDNYGNYVDLGVSGKFMSRPAAHNAVELSSSVGPVAVSGLLGTNDRKLNRGFLRLYGKYSPIPVLALSLGYRANLFDRFKFPDDEIVQRYNVGAAYKLPAGWKAFAEAAILQVVNKDNETPVLLVIQPPTGKFLDLLSLETEYVKNRTAAKKPREWLFNLHARKSVGRVKIDAGCYSDPADKDWNATQIGLRMTSNIK
jgi:hypothetical protein